LPGWVPGRLPWSSRLIARPVLLVPSLPRSPSLLPCCCDNFCTASRARPWRARPSGPGRACAMGAGSPLGVVLEGPGGRRRRLGLRGSLAVVRRQRGPPPQRRGARRGPLPPRRSPAPATRPGHPPSRTPVAAPAQAAGPSSRAGRFCRRESSQSRALRPTASASLAAQAQTLDSEHPRQEPAPIGEDGQSGSPRCCNRFV
jgi:hypothetical protein